MASIIANTSGALDLSAVDAQWVVEAARKLEALGHLRANWDSYGGKPLNQGIKKFTVQVLKSLRNEDLPIPAVVLGSGGTIQLEWHVKQKELEVELRDDNTIEFMKVLQNGDTTEGEARDNVAAALRGLSRWLQE